jgi:PAS domain-containing protein
MMSSALLTDPDQSAIPAISLQHALNAAQLGSWQYDALCRVFRWDARSKEILGAPATGATVEEFMNCVQPDDTAEVWATFNAVLDPAEPKRYRNEFRVRRRDGGVPLGGDPGPCLF